MKQILTFVWGMLIFSAQAGQYIKTYDFRPECFPFSLTPVILYDQVQFVDFDHDGSPEIINYNVRENDGTPPHMQIRDQKTDVISRLNYDPRVQLKPPAFFIDIDDDLRPEILLPFLFQDSLFIDVYKVGQSVDRLHRILITTGQARVRDDGGIHPWDPAVYDLFLIDRNRDGRKELLSVVRVYHAREKRGVYLHAFPEGELLDEYLIGAQPSRSFLEDFDGDGAPELILRTSTPMNGADVNGFSDDYSYLILFELNPRLAVKESVMLSTGYNVESEAFYGNFIGDDAKEFLTLTLASDTDAAAQLRIINPQNLKTEQTRRYDFPVENATVFASPDHRYQRVLLVKRNNRVAIIDHTLHVDSLFVWPERLISISEGPDIDRDGYPEYIFQGAFKAVLVDHRFRILSDWPGTGFVAERQARDGSTELIVETNHPEIGVFKVERNRYFWVHRHIVPILGALLAAFVLLVLAFALKEHTQHKSINRFIEHLVESDVRAIAIVDRKLRVLGSNQQLLDWFGLHRNAKRRPLDDWLHDYPLIAETLREWRDGYTHIRRDKLLTLQTALGRRTLRLIFEPVPRTLFAKRVFQVTFYDQSVQAELLKAKSWTTLAQRVAHDIKNPLGAILLVLQKLRTLVDAGTPSIDLLAYFIKIEERIEALRMMTRNFMKFINLETPHFATVDLYDFLNQRLDDAAKNLPPDIRLLRKIPEQVTPVDLDAEQMQSVCENLISNAVDAMPKGGVITVSLSVAHRLQFPGHDDRPRAYALVEVQDDGIGMPPEALDHLFEPNFTYAKESSGLGLAIVKKIIEDHGGHIEVESESGSGTIFTIHLPLKVDG